MNIFYFIRSLWGCSTPSTQTPFNIFRLCQSHCFFLVFLTTFQREQVVFFQWKRVRSKILPILFSWTIDKNFHSSFKNEVGNLVKSACWSFITCHKLLIICTFFFCKIMIIQGGMEINIPRILAPGFLNTDFEVWRYWLLPYPIYIYTYCICH